MDEKEVTGINLGTLYDFNKRLMLQQPVLKGDDFSLKMASIGGWFSTHVNERYFMLLCRERNDYTVFHFKQHNYNKAVKELEELLENRGSVIDIQYIHDGDCYDIWVRDETGEEPEAVMYKFFVYDSGVIEVI